MTNTQSFPEFLRGWIVDNIKPGEHSDPAAFDELIRRSSNELTTLAQRRGDFDSLLKEALPYGDVVGYIRYLYKLADSDDD